MRVYIDEDEQWPFYTVTQDEGYTWPADLTDEEVMEYDEVMARFWTWQSRLRAIVNEQQK